VFEKQWETRVWGHGEGEGWGTKGKVGEEVKRMWDKWEGTMRQFWNW
jgi:hypothetical protein